VELRTRKGTHQRWTREEDAGDEHRGATWRPQAATERRGTPPAARTAGLEVLASTEENDSRDSVPKEDREAETSDANGACAQCLRVLNEDVCARATSTTP